MNKIQSISDIITNSSFNLNPIQIIDL
jgi:hypothetical protein